MTMTTRVTHDPTRRRCALWLGALALSPAARAQEPLRLLVGFPAGITDQTARLLGEHMGTALSLSVVVDARPGAAGRLAIEATRAARPDGQTLMVVPHGSMTLFPHVFRQLRYDPVRDFVPVLQLVHFDFALAVAPGVAVQRLQDLPAWVRARSAATGYGSPGVGTVLHFLGERYAAMTGLALTHVAYKSPAEAVTAMMGEQLPLAFLPLGDLLPGARAGRLRLLASTGADRAPQTPELPTFREAGVDLQLRGWLGLYAPAGTPDERVAELARAATDALHQPRVRQALETIGLTVSGATGAELARLQAAETRLWDDVVRQVGFQPQ
jgi:tripartite-type tricarboxylate transporter receptor subunit TctC